MYKYIFIYMYRLELGDLKNHTMNVCIIALYCVLCDFFSFLTRYLCSSLRIYWSHLHPEKNFSFFIIFYFYFCFSFYFASLIINICRSYFCWRISLYKLHLASHTRQNNKIPFTHKQNFLSVRMNRKCTKLIFILNISFKSNSKCVFFYFLPNNKCTAIKVRVNFIYLFCWS